MEGQIKRITIKRVLQYLLLLIIALLLIYFSFRGVDWEEFKKGMSECNWWWIGLSMVIGGLEFWVRAIRWRLLLDQVHSPNKTLNDYRGVTIGNLSNFAIPRIGEIVRCSVVSTTDRLPFEAGVGTVIVERGWDLMCLLILTATMFLTENRFGNFIKTQILDKIESSSLSSIKWLVILFVVVVIIVTIFILIKSNSKGSKLHSIFSRFKGGIFSVFKMRRKWFFFLLTAILWGSFLLTSKLTILAFNDLSALNWNDALFLMIVGGLGWAVPVQAGIGAYHFIVSLALVNVYGVSQSEGLAFATISHSSQAIVMIILGVISLIGYTFQKRKLLKE